MNELDKPSKERRSVPELTNIYAMVYMLLKKIEMRSYEQFWESIYNMSYASLSRQKYLQDERQLGLRYLKSKVNAILDSVEREYWFHDILYHLLFDTYWRNNEWIFSIFFSFFLIFRICVRIINKNLDGLAKNKEDLLVESFTQKKLLSISLSLKFKVIDISKELP